MTMTAHVRPLASAIKEGGGILIAYFYFCANRTMSHAALFAERQRQRLQLTRVRSAPEWLHPTLHEAWYEYDRRHAYVSDILQNPCAQSLEYAPHWAQAY